MKLARVLLRALGAYRAYEYLLEREVKSSPLPQHVALILDGNRRWARARGLPSWAGYEAGAKRAEEVLRWCLDLGVKIVTLYVLSTENLRRPREELREIFRVLKRYLKKALESKELDKYQVRVKALGKLDLLPPDLRELLKLVERHTAKYDKHFLNIAVAYGGRAEIVEAVKRVLNDYQKGLIKPEDLNEKTFERYLYTSHLPKPDPDLVIRTSGEVRLSNFLLWQLAYSELVFVDVPWPDFRRIDLLRAIRTYQKRQRRFGL